MQIKIKSNGPVAVEELSNGGGPPAAVLDDVEKEVTVLERKLEDLKNKNNVSCSWESGMLLYCNHGTIVLLCSRN